MRIAWARALRAAVHGAVLDGRRPDQAAHEGHMGRLPRRSREQRVGGTVMLSLTPSPMPVRFLRIWMTESSNTCDTHGSADRRNCVGYAIREIYLGTASADGKFHDLVRHTADPDQTATYCSSVDPWHEPADIGPTERDQVGLDLFYTSGYTRGLPAMIPVAMLYGTPEDSAAQIAYLKKRGLSDLVHRDGRRARRTVHASGRLRRALPAMGNGAAPGRSGAETWWSIFQGVNEDILVWPDCEQGRHHGWDDSSST